MEILSIDQMKARYPEEWVLVGNPNLGNPEGVGTVLKRLIEGVVLCHGQDKRQVAEAGREARKGYEHVTLIYTGEIPSKRKFWL